MDSVNNFCLVGRLTKDPELKELDNGTKYTNIVVVTNKKYKDKEGNKIPEFHHITVWNKFAERVCNTAKKGSLVHFGGSNSSERFETKEGKIIYASKLVVEEYDHLAFAKDDADNVIEENEAETEKSEEMEK